MRNKILIFLMIFICLSSFVFSECDLNTLNNGIVSYLKLEESESIYNDSTGNTSFGNGNDPTRTTGVINYGQSFDGTDDYMKYNTDIYNLEEYTYSYWLKFDSVGRFHTQIYYVAIGGGTHGTNVQIGVTNALEAFSYKGVGGGYDLWRTEELSPNVLYHVIVLYNGTTQKIYLNGSLNGSLIASSPGSISYIGADDFEFGGSPSDRRYTDGLIDEFAVFNYALEQDCIDFLYNSGSPGIAQQYPFLSVVPVVIYSVVLTSNTQPQNITINPGNTSHENPNLQVLTNIPTNCTYAVNNNSAVNCDNFNSIEHDCNITDVSLIYGMNNITINCSNVTVDTSINYINLDDKAPDLIVYNPLNIEYITLSLFDINITYNCSDINGLKNASLFIDDELISYNDSVTNNSISKFVFTPTLFKNYSYYIDCYDNIPDYNRNISDTYWFYLNKNLTINYTVTDITILYGEIFYSIDFNPDVTVNYTFGKNSDCDLNPNKDNVINVSSITIFENNLDTNTNYYIGLTLNADNYTTVKLCENVKTLLPNNLTTAIFILFFLILIFVIYIMVNRYYVDILSGVCYIFISIYIANNLPSYFSFGALFISVVGIMMLIRGIKYKNE